LASGAFISEADIPKSSLDSKVVTTEHKVRKHFKDTPIMVKVAYCESRFRQFNPDGSIFKGIVNDKDLGVFQINTDYHLEDSQKMGLDIKTLEGNMEYAEYLFNTQGLSPWSASRACWSR
jgi:hypothetical protein